MGVEKTINAILNLFKQVTLIGKQNHYQRILLCPLKTGNQMFLWEQYHFKSRGCFNVWQV